MLRVDTYISVIGVISYLCSENVHSGNETGLFVSGMSPSDFFQPFIDWADGFGLLGLALVSASEAALQPIPPDVLLIPLALGLRAKAFRLALICSLGSILGAILGYAIGSFLWWEGIGQFSWLASLFFDLIPGFTPEVFYSIQTKYEVWNFWVVFTAGFTPIPFKVIT